MIKSGKQWNGELINKKKSGETYYEEMAISPIFNNKGEIVNFVAIKRDIRDRKLAETKIQEAGQRLELALEGRNLGSLDVDLTTGITVVNERYKEISDLPMDEPLTTTRER